MTTAMPILATQLPEGTLPLETLLLAGCCGHKRPQPCAAGFLARRTRLLGLDGAGKTSILARLMGDDPRTVLPTLGFSIRAFQLADESTWDASADDDDEPAAPGACCAASEAAYACTLAA